MSDDYMQVNSLDKIKLIIGIAKFEDTTILIDTDEKLSDNITMVWYWLHELLDFTVCFIHKYF